MRVSAFVVRENKGLREYFCTPGGPYFSCTNSGSSLYRQADLPWMQPLYFVITNCSSGFRSTTVQSFA